MKNWGNWVFRGRNWGREQSGEKPFSKASDFEILKPLKPFLWKPFWGDLNSHHCINLGWNLDWVTFKSQFFERRDTKDDSSLNEIMNFKIHRKMKIWESQKFNSAPKMNVDFEKKLIFLLHFSRLQWHHPSKEEHSI